VARTRTQIVQLEAAIDEAASADDFDRAESLQGELEHSQSLVSTQLAALREAGGAVEAVQRAVTSSGSSVDVDGGEDEEGNAGYTPVDWADDDARAQWIDQAAGGAVSEASTDAKGSAKGEEGARELDGKIEDAEDEGSAKAEEGAQELDGKIEDAEDEDAAMAGEGAQELDAGKVEDAEDEGSAMAEEGAQVDIPPSSSGFNFMASSGQSPSTGSDDVGGASQGF